MRSTPHSKFLDLCQKYGLKVIVTFAMDSALYPDLLDRHTLAEVCRPPSEAKTKGFVLRLASKFGTFHEFHFLRKAILTWPHTPPLLVVAHFGPPKFPKCLEDALFWDQK